MWKISAEMLKHCGKKSEKCWNNVRKICEKRDTNLITACLPPCLLLDEALFRGLWWASRGLPALWWCPLLLLDHHPTLTHCYTGCTEEWLLWIMFDWGWYVVRARANNGQWRLLESECKCVIPIPIPGAKSLIPILIPIPGIFQMFNSDSYSDSSQKWNHSGINSDSGIGIVHHCPQLWFPSATSLSECPQPV